MFDGFLQEFSDLASVRLEVGPSSFIKFLGAEESPKNTQCADGWLEAGPVIDCFL